MLFLLVVRSLCFCCLVGEVKSVSVMEGGSVTLYNNFTDMKRAHMITWSFGPQEALLVRINREANSVSVNDDVYDGMFRHRLQVDAQTGSLTITNITTEHSGLYHITISGKHKSSYRFSVNVHARLPIPDIISYCAQNSSSSSKCVVLCSVLNVSHVSLSWYKGSSLLSSISVSDLNRLSLPLEVDYEDTNTHTCVLNNTITNHTQHLNITEVCQPCSECVCCCYVSEAVIRLVISGLVGVATVAVLAYDIRSDRRDEQKKKRSQRLSEHH